eukprot:CAMPEP_0196585540 /NCGR_PEP_ID=MMETSP1081-20130531/51092_1 /TAXON_ID=36882 /ORGANISM="Pyramimonas amylifera, Strain CCMP720" /LENGTH=152 /DNA_ID=CAMNT_0041907123 /DNA_START=241 /DNA_END=696 /DNA_ORIENTATION=-
MELDVVGPCEEQVHYPSQEEVMKVWKSQLLSGGLEYQKCVQMWAKQAKEKQCIETLTNGEKETQKTCEVGDWILFNPQGGEMYSVSDETFRGRYIPESDENCGRVSRPKTPNAIQDDLDFKPYVSCGKAIGLKMNESDITTFFPDGFFMAKW